MRQILIAGNWKLNGTLSETESLLTDLIKAGAGSSSAAVIICPPYTSISLAARLLNGSKIMVGAQDMSEHSSGAYTAEVSAQMLLTAGATHVILGHSERRQYHAESDEQVNCKAKAALATGLTPIICVGETLEQREAGQTDEVIGRQIDGTIADFDSKMLTESVIAYEPVWAIGTGKTATPEMAQAVHRFIRDRLAGVSTEAAESVQILYGGSVKPDNAGQLLGQPDIDGALVGGAALVADDFLAIINAL